MQGANRARSPEPSWERNLVEGKVAHHLECRPQQVELLENQPDSGYYALIGVKHQMTVRVVDVASRRRTTEFTFFGNVYVWLPEVSAAYHEVPYGSKFP